MRRYIFTERGGIYIIDLQQTLDLVEQAAAFVRNVAERGGSVLFVGTKKQARTRLQKRRRVGMPFVNHRWLGGLLTNWRTISERIERLHELTRLRDEGHLELLPPKERMAMAELEKLETNLGGVTDMKRPPDAMFVIDLRKEQLAIREARRLGMPVVGLVTRTATPTTPTTSFRERRCHPLLQPRRARRRERHRAGGQEQGHRRGNGRARGRAARARGRAARA